MLYSAAMYAICRDDLECNAVSEMSFSVIRAIDIPLETQWIKLNLTI